MHGHQQQQQQQHQQQQQQQQHQQQQQQQQQHHHHHQPNSHQALLRQSLHHLHTPIVSSIDDLGLSTSAGSVSAYSDSDYASPVDYPQTPEDMSYIPPGIPIYNNFNQQTSTFENSPSGSLIFDTRGPTSCPEQYYGRSSMSSSMSSDQSNYEFAEAQGLPASPMGPCSLSETFYDDEIPGTSPWHPHFRAI
jgi:hypothetical protein